MPKPDEWSPQLQALSADLWPEYLTAHSGLPGRRANLTLLDAAARLADEPVIDELLRDGGEYPTMCAAAATARLASDPGCEVRARALATDERWRVREGVVIGLQLLGDEQPDALIALAQTWADDSDLLVQRTAVAAICEPRLLRDAAAAASAIDICRRCTEHLRNLPSDRRTDPATRTLRQALGYCWSVAVAAYPEPGLAAFHALAADDPDVAWIVRENLRKKRLATLL